MPDTTENKAFLEETPAATEDATEMETEKEAPKPAAASSTTDPNKPNPNRLYFGNLPFDKGDEDVRTVFSSCGEVTDIHIIRDRFTKRSRGYGFITFATSEGKDKALQLDGKEFFGRAIKVNLEARNSAANASTKSKQRIFIKNIPKDKTEDDVKGIFEKYGTIENFFFIKDHNTNTSRGFGFMDFSSAAEASAALAMHQQEAFGNTLVVKIAEEKGSRGRGRGGSRNFGRGRGRGRGWGAQAYQPYGGGYGYGSYGAGYGGYGGYGGGYGGYGGGYGYPAAGGYGGYGATGYGYS